MKSNASFGLGAVVESVSVLFIIVAFWWAASHGEWLSKVFLPTPESTWSSLVDGLSQGALVANSIDTVNRMLMGWLLASLFGIGLGAFIGVSATARVWIQPTLEVIRPLPASAIMPLAIAIFGLNASMVLFVVAFGSMWPVLLATVHGFGAVHPRLKEVAGALQMTRSMFSWKIALPSALPDILAGMRLSMTVALIIAVVGEMVASQSGLGQAVLLAARSFHASDLFACVVLLGAIGFIANGLLALAEKTLLRWQQR